jgi:peptide/nickel transport system substrate-binding protein
MLRRRAVVALLAAVVLAAVALTPAGAQPRRGGVLRIAFIGEPPTLDLHWTTALITQDITSHIYEGLLAMNSKFEVSPMLAERWTSSKDRLTYTFTLRRGIRFHHGKEMTAEDVVASLTRWGRIATGGRRVFAVVDSLTAPDPHTVVFRLKEPYALLPLELGYYVQPAVIYPKEVIDEVGTGMVRRFIGTGPYRFVEHLPDRHIRLDRYDGYQSRTEEGDGFAGRKAAYADSLYFYPVPDAAVRIAGVRRGDYHFGDNVPADEYERLRADPAVKTYLSGTPWWLTMVFNKRAGMMTNPKIRQAFNTALDKEAIMRASIGPRALWRLDSSIMASGHPMWTDSGKEFYNQKNPERARQLLAEAGYKGEPVRWLTTTEYAYMGTAAVAAKPMLERAGFVVDLQFVDWATLVARRSRPELYDVFITGFSLVPDPTFLLALSPVWPGWYENRDMQAMLTLLRRHTDPKVRMDIWKRAQRLYYEDMPAVKVGDFFYLHVARREFEGYTGRPMSTFWNTWLSR